MGNVSVHLAMAQITIAAQILNIGMEQLVLLLRQLLLIVIKVTMELLV